MTISYDKNIIHYDKQSCLTDKNNCHTEALYDTEESFKGTQGLSLIHICHLLYGVDDGSKSLEESVEMLKIAKKQGITGIILTPHLRHGMSVSYTHLDVYKRQEYR